MFPKWSEACLSWLQHLLVSQAGSHNGSNLETLSWRRLPTSCPPAGRGGLAVCTIPLHSRGQMLFMAVLSGKESHHSFGECPNAASQCQTLWNHKVLIFPCCHGSIVKAQFSLEVQKGFLALSEKSEKKFCPVQGGLGFPISLAERGYKGQFCAEIQRVGVSLFAVNCKLLLTPDLLFTPPWAVTWLSQLEDVLRGTWSLALPYQAWIWDRWAAQGCDVQLGTPW